jgi:hypothetical protein
MEESGRGEVAEDKKKMEESEVEGWDLLMAHY